MTGGVIKDNNNSLTETKRRAAKGDGVYVGTAFNLGDDAEVSTNNDVYLVQGSSIPKEGRYINVISPYTGASTAKPIQIHSEDRTVEDTEIGTQLVRYTTDAGGEAAAATADADGVFVPSWKMPKGLVIGQSKGTGKTDWMTYVSAAKIRYQWVSTDNPTDVAPPANDYIRNGAAYTAKAQQKSQQGYSFDGWYTDERCTLPYADGTVLNTDTVLYGKWTKDSETPNQPSKPDVPSKPEAPVTPNQPSKPDVPSSPGAQAQLPQTGDPMNSALWISLMGLSLAGLLGSLVVAKKNNYRGKQMK